MVDTRRVSLKLLAGKLEVSSFNLFGRFILCLFFALIIAFYPEYEGMTEAARWAFFILLFAAGLWVTEAIPAFAVALLVMALEIAILGNPRLGIFATKANDWQIFVDPWASPLIWLFFGGFILARAASKTELDHWFATHVLIYFGKKPGAVLIGVMAITFCFSMFVSNTATTVMMMAVVAPVVSKFGASNPFSKAILIAVPFAANIGGMGTIIGSPPNAIAAGSLGLDQINFLKWMVVGVPPALILSLILWLFLMRFYPSSTDEIDISSLMDYKREAKNLAVWRKVLVMIIFFITVGLWLSCPIHQIPTPVISFIPISIFAIVKVIDVEDIRGLSWDILLLLAGGLSLGVAVSKTGLASWMASTLPSDNLSVIGLAFGFSYLTVILSNFMSNTAAANILIPIGLAASASMEPLVVIPIALGASSAMCLPISTPPNAVAYATGNISSKDFLRGGILIGLIAPVIGTLWCYFVFTEIFYRP